MPKKPRASEVRKPTVVDRSKQSDSKLAVKLWAWLDMSAVLMPLGLAVFGCVAVALVLCGQLRNMVVWPLGLAAQALQPQFVKKLVFDYQQLDQPVGSPPVNSHVVRETVVLTTVVPDGSLQGFSLR